MVRKILSALLLFASFVNLSAGELKYPVSAIPASLKENAKTVIRFFKEELEIKSEKLAISNITEVRTILNKNGEHDGCFLELYSPMRRISSLKGKVFNELGKQIKNLGSEDIQDYSYISNFSMYDDNRVKFIDPKNMTYPFTVEYSYQVELKQTLFLPTWSHAGENTSYESSVFIVKAPIGYQLHYKEYNLPSPVSKSTADGKDIYTWSLSNLKARSDEPMTSFSNPDYPLVKIKPTNFTVGETQGSTASWKELGMWASTLNDKKDQLPETTVTKLKEITANCKTDFEKIKKVYEYMQSKTRYVSIQVGIGDWKPFDATIVDKLSYGDCKALSNYTKSLLSAIGIKSYYTLVKAGSENNSIDNSFPSSQFNHAIVCVPIDKDTVWLECTNQRMPCGYNGDFTDDRDVLLVDGENSKLVHTRKYSAEENCINRFSKVVINDETTGESQVRARYTGLCYDDLMPIYYADNADKLKQVTQRIKLPSFTLNKFDYQENRSRTPYFDEYLNISVTNYVHKMADNIFLLPLNFMNKLSSIPEKVRNRKTEMCIRRPYMENDTVQYQLPKEFQITDLPSKSEINGKFGKYSASVEVKAGIITYTRHFELFKGTFPPEAYTEFRDFLEEISTADEAVVSMKRI
jgi:transglutaminase-like putative cysteine protease